MACNKSSVLSHLPRHRFHCSLTAYSCHKQPNKCKKFPIQNTKQYRTPLDKYYNLHTLQYHNLIKKSFSTYKNCNPSLDTHDKHLHTNNNSFPSSKHLHTQHKLAQENKHTLYTNTKGDRREKLFTIPNVLTVSRMVCLESAPDGFAFRKFIFFVDNDAIHWVSDHEW